MWEYGKADPKGGTVAIGTWLTFLTTLLVAVAVPGPDFVVVVQAAARSARSGIATAAGTIAGLCLHAALAIGGLAALLSSLPGALSALRVVGAGVLLWMGIAMLRGWRTHAAPAAAHPRAESGGGFLRGFLTNATNPKTLLFFAAILPQFIGAGPGAALRTSVLAATVIGVSVLWWAVMIALIRATGFGGSPRADRLITLGGGLALTGIALALAAATAIEAWG